MLRSLRIKLALLYFGSALGIVVLLAAGTYVMLNRFFIQQVDLALEYKMAAQFELYGLTLPPELINAEQHWMDENQHAIPIVNQTPMYPSPTPEPSAKVMKPPLVNDGSESQDSESDEDEGEIIETNVPQHEEEETEGVSSLETDSFDGRLSSIFVVPISTPQGIIAGTQPVSSPIDEDFDASLSALSHGFDLRTVSLSDGTRVRLLTYRMDGNGTPGVIQIGRLLDDQDRLLQLYLIGLSALGFIVSFIISILSWILSGRSIKPAQKAWDRQQHFIANASHEMRAPLTLIRANADYAIRSGKSQVLRSALMDVMGEVDHMNHLVDDQLLLSRLDAHQIKMDRKEMNVDLTLMEIVRQEAVIASSRGVQIKSKKSGCMIIGDPDRTRQVILTLIDNALRFTKPGGSIELGAVMRKGLVDIYVRDDGIGISPEHLEKIFERFYQVPGDNVPETHNSGLGLSIARALVEAQGGNMRIESNVGSGTIVWLSMPSK